MIKADQKRSKAEQASEPAPLILVINWKGGVGKTTVTLGIAGTMIVNRIDPIIINLEADNWRLKKCYPDREVHHCSWKEGLIPLYRTIQASSAERPILVDTPGQINSEWTDPAQIRRFNATLKRVGRPLRYLFVVAPGLESLRHLAHFIQTVGVSNVDVILNRRAGLGSLQRWEESNARQKILDAGGKILTMPAISTELIELMDGQNLSFDRALDAVDEMPWLEGDLEGFFIEAAAQFLPFLEGVA